MIRKITYLVLAFCTVLTISATAQYSNPASSGSYGLAMGDIKSIQVGPESCFSNPGTISLSPSSSISSFIDSRYFINNLFGAYLGGILALDNSAFSLDYYNYGWEDYSENFVGLAYGRKLMKDLSFGVKFKLYDFNLEEYGRQNAYSLDLGVNQKVNDKLSVGVILSNPVGSELTEQSSITAGASYRFNDKFTAALEFFKEEDFDLEARFGFHYQFLDKLGLMAGYQSREHQFSFGLRLIPISRVDLTASATLHPTLGISSSVGVNYRFEG